MAGKRGVRASLHSDGRVSLKTGLETNNCRLAGKDVVFQVSRADPSLNGSVSPSIAIYLREQITKHAKARQIPVKHWPKDLRVNGRITHGPHSS